MVTGMRIGLGNAFISIAAAEMLSAQSGMGFLIWFARSLMLTDQVFVGFLVLGPARPHERPVVPVPHSAAVAALSHCVIAPAVA